MGLLDVVLGNMMGGGQGPARTSSSSPLIKALMLLLAAKGVQHYTSNREGGSSGGMGGGFGGQSSPMGGGLGGMFGSGGTGPGMGGAGMGGLGGLGGGGLGSLVSGGLGGLLGGLVSGGGLSAIVNQFRQNGHGNAIDSWVGHGQNHRLAPNELAQALGPDTVDELERETGMPRDQVLSELSQELPDAVDQFTPDGRIPSEDEFQSRWGSR